jgi:hypothetical protein
MKIIYRIYRYGTNNINEIGAYDLSLLEKFKNFHRSLRTIENLTLGKDGYAIYYYIQYKDRERYQFKVNFKQLENIVKKNLVYFSNPAWEELENDLKRDTKRKKRK